MIVKLNLSYIVTIQYKIWFIMYLINGALLKHLIMLSSIFLIELIRHTIVIFHNKELSNIVFDHTINNIEIEGTHEEYINYWNPFSMNEEPFLEHEEYCYLWAQFYVYYKQNNEKCSY